MRWMGLLLFPKASAFKAVFGAAFAALFLFACPFRAPLVPYGIFSALGFLVFYLMMNEDYHDNTIDMVLAAALATFFALASGHPVAYALTFLAGLSVMQAILHLTARSETSEASSGSDETETGTAPSDDAVQLPPGAYGWLPSFGLAVVLSLGFLHVFDGEFPFPLSDAERGLDALLGILSPDGLPPLPFLFLSVALWAVLAERNRRREKSSRLVYGFGDGDGYVFASFLAFLGLKTFLAVFFLNMLLLLASGLPEALSRWGRH